MQTTYPPLPACLLPPNTKRLFATGYVRARYNAGVACINLRLYHEAAAHFLAALALQQSGADPQGSAMSDTIW